MNNRDYVPESREVYEHGNREFDRKDAAYAKANMFLAGTIVGMIVATVILGIVS